VVPQRGAGRTATRGRQATAEGSASTRSHREVGSNRPATPPFSSIVVAARGLGDCYTYKGLGSQSASAAWAGHLTLCEGNPVFKLKTVALWVATAIAFAGPGTVTAHHGWAWTEDQESQLSGTIVSISHGNLHVHLTLRNEQGLWEVDLAPP
jgi:hypothetical protein